MASNKNERATGAMSPGIDARRFLAARETSFAGNAFSSKEQVRELVDALLENGADAVNVVEINESESYSATLLVRNFRMERRLHADLVKVIVDAKPDEFDEVTDGVFRLWWD